MIEIEQILSYLDEDTEILIRRVSFGDKKYAIRMMKLYRNTPYLAERIFGDEDIEYLDRILESLKERLEKH